MRVAAHTPRKVVGTGKLERPHVARRGDLASVEDLDDVDLRRDVLERDPAQVPSTVPTEWMGDVCQPALSMDEIDGAIGGQSRWNSLFEVQTDELAVGGRDFLAAHHLKTGVHLPEPEAAFHSVVVPAANRARRPLAREVRVVRPGPAGR